VPLATAYIRFDFEVHMTEQKILKRVLLCLLMTLVSAASLCAHFISLQLHSYHGSELIPHDAHSTYLQNTHCTLGHQHCFDSGFSVSVQGKYIHDYFNESIRLDSLCISQKLGKWSTQYAIYNKDFGKHSIIYQQDASSSTYGHGLLERYRFNGLAVQHHGTRKTLRAGVGGNELNRTLGFGEYRISGTNHTFALGALYAARSNLNNQNEIALYTETSFSQGSLQVYSAGMAEYYRATAGEKETTRIQLYLEPQWNPADWLLLATGIHLSSLDCQRAWNNGNTYTLSAMTQASWQGWQTTFIQHISHADMLDFAHSQIILAYFLRSFWQVGLSAARYAPDPGIETWQIGLQTILHYETR
jgi:hypothetical protein